MPDIWMDVDTALSEVPVNVMPLIDDTDFKSIEGAVAYNAAGMALRWHFVTPAGAYTVTSVTPTTGGNYDWTDQGDSGIYTIEIPASGGASINNDTEGFGWFTGVATGILPWRGPIIGFRAAGLNDLMIESAYSTTRGLSGTALPNAAAAAQNGLMTCPVSGNVLPSGAITSSVLATGCIDNTHLAADAIGGDELAATAIAKIATGIWQDSTAGDFTTASSIGKALYIANVAPGAAGGHMISGSNAGTITFGAFTVTGDTTLTGAVSLGSTLGITGAFTASNASNNIVGIDVAKISGDSAAADNLESYFDGTGYGEILQRTTIATLANQQEFTLTAGSADNNAYTLCDIVIQDQSTSTQKTICSVLVYVGATKTVYLYEAPKFTIATGDIVTILSPRSYGILVNTGSGLDALGGTLDDINGRIPAALVGGRMDSSVGAMAANVLTAAATHSDFTTEIQTGLATASALSTLSSDVATVATYVDTEVAAIKAKTDLIPADPADASDIAASFSSVSSALTTIDDFLDTEIAAIKAKTDNLPASPAAVGSAMTLSTAYDLYHADIDLRIDDVNSQDEWTITWFKNGARQSSGITVPTIQVVKRADGTDLIASTTPTQIGATGSYKHDATTTARTTAGEAVLAIVTATIDGSTRSFSRLVGRDSTV